MTGRWGLDLDGDGDSAETVWKDSLHPGPEGFAYMSVFPLLASEL